MAHYLCMTLSELYRCWSINSFWCVCLSMEFRRKKASKRKYYWRKSYNGSNPTVVHVPCISTCTVYTISICYNTDVLQPAHWTMGVHNSITN